MRLVLQTRKEDRNTNEYENQMRYKVMYNKEHQFKTRKGELTDLHK